MHCLRRCDRNDETTASLVCFPPAGGGVASFATWRDGWPAEFALYVVCLAGRDHRLDEPLSADLPGTARQIAEELDQSRLADGELSFFGHSLGGLLAFEVAQQMPADRLRHLFVAACAAPQLANPHPPLGALPPDEFLPTVKSRYGGFDDRLLSEGEWLVEMIPRLRSDLRMAESYATEVRPLSIPLTALAGTEDGTISPAALVAWKEQTTDSFHHRWLPGGHFFPQSAPRRVLRIVTEKMRRR